MATCPGPKVQGRRGNALAAALGIAAVVSATPPVVLAEEFLIPSIIAPDDPPLPNLSFLPSKGLHPVQDFVVPIFPEQDEIFTLTLEARERYNRLTDELIANGLPNYLKPHKFAVRCLAVTDTESEIDAVSVHAWTEVWYAADRLRHIASSRKDREPELRQQIMYETWTKETWPHNDLPKTCNELAPTAKAGLRDLNRIYAKNVDAAKAP